MSCLVMQSQLCSLTETERKKEQCTADDNCLRQREEYLTNTATETRHISFLINCGWLPSNSNVCCRFILSMVSITWMWNCFSSDETRSCLLKFLFSSKQFAGGDDVICYIKGKFVVYCMHLMAKHRTLKVLTKVKPFLLIFDLFLALDTYFTEEKPKW